MQISISSLVLDRWYLVDRKRKTIVAGPFTTPDEGFEEKHRRNIKDAPNKVTHEVLGGRHCWVDGIMQ